MYLVHLILHQYLFQSFLLIGLKDLEVEEICV